MEREKIKEAIAQLKDFQLKTVDYVFDQLYNKNRTKMLIADEVGLGKTIVAKGIIAKAFKKFLDEGGPTKENPTFNVVYICSNLSLAQQNIRKLNLMKDEEYVDDIITRLNYLAYRPTDKPKIFLINALTPGTSFDERSSQGERGERAILYMLLHEYSPFINRENGLLWLLKGNIKNIDNWKKILSDHYYDKSFRLRNDLYNKFRQELFDIKINKEDFPRLFEYLNNKEGWCFWDALKRVCENIDGRNAHLFNIQGEIIRHLRRILSKLCLEYLSADIYILDEFQRYSNLIKLHEVAENPAIELAREIFEDENAKILMLSATPFKPYTNDYDELNGEVHHKEFESVLKFLMKDEPDEFWDNYKKDQREFFDFLKKPDEIENRFSRIAEVKTGIENTYRKALVRTEKLIAANDRDALISSVLKDKTLPLQPEDIEDFVNLDRITQHLNNKHSAKLPVPLEYVKSSPFALSFLDNYQHKKRMEEAVDNDKELQGLIKKTGHAWLNMEKIDKYNPIIPRKSNKLPNAKLRLLLDETVENGGWKYLWIPPSISYYPFDGPYENSEKYSKSLIFSSWLLVPKMISAIVSYEAERQCIGNPLSISEKERIEEKRKYFTKRRSPRPQFTFKVEKEDGEPQQMTGFAYLFPSEYLSSIYDPVENIKEQKSAEFVKEEIVRRIMPQLKSIVEIYGRESKGEWRRWFWAAPVLLEKGRPNESHYLRWFSSGLEDSGQLIDAEDESTQSSEESGKEKHFNFAGELFTNPEKFNLPTLNGEQLILVAEFLSGLCLASPAVCSLRSLRKYNYEVENILKYCFEIALGFVTLFNKPESIAVVRLTVESRDYLEGVLKYSVAGNIQSMLDEYIYLLISCENIKTPKDIAQHLNDVLSTRTSTTQVDDLNSFFLRHVNGTGRRSKSIRSHFAADFGNQKVNTANSAGRQINIRSAFNSPFRPFVLATTSIGQEGLDFHLYCKKIFHWNLPANPIDLEQREGRIHRYQGLVIRRNVVDKYLSQTEFQTGEEVWDKIFKAAEAEKLNAKTKCDLVPYWHIETNSNIKIERFVPLYPFSRDIEKYKQLIKVLTLYRLTFGQPRQEELIDSLYEGNLEGVLDGKLDQLLINLSPLLFYKT